MAVSQHIDPLTCIIGSQFLEFPDTLVTLEEGVNYVYATAAGIATGQSETDAQRTKSLLPLWQLTVVNNKLQGYVDLRCYGGVGSQNFVDSSLPAPAYGTAATIISYENVRGNLQDFAATVNPTNIPTDGSAVGFAWCIRKSQDPTGSNPGQGGASVIRAVRMGSGTDQDVIISYTSTNKPRVGRTVLVIAGCSNHTNNWNVGVTSGWIAIDPGPAAGGITGTQMRAYYKVWTNADDLSLTQTVATHGIGNGSSSTIAYEIDGCDTSTTFDAISGNIDSSGQTPCEITTPSVTPTQLSDLAIAAIATGAYSATTGPLTVPGTWTADGVVSNTHSGVDSALGVAHLTSLTTDTTSAIGVTLELSSAFDGSVPASMIVLIKSLDPGGVTGGTTYPWIIYFEDSIPGIPVPAASQTIEGSFGQVSAGVFYDMGLAYVDMRGAIGPIAAFITSYQATDLQLPNHYFINGHEFLPVVSPGIPPGTPGYPSGEPDIQPGVVQNPISTAWTVAFQVSNQPLDGSLSRISMWYRQQGNTQWSYYAGISAEGVGEQPADLPLIGTYLFTYEDLTNGGAWDFGMSCEDTQGGDTDVVFITSSTSVPGYGSSGNLCPDSDWKKAAWGAQGAPNNKAFSDPYWYGNLLDGAFSELVSGAGSNTFQVNFNSGGTETYLASSPITVIPGEVYTLAVPINAGDASGGLTGGPFAALCDGTNGPYTTIFTDSTAQQTPGKDGLVQVQWTCPSDGSVLSVRVLLDSDGCAVGSGAPLAFSHVMFEGSTAYTGYTTGPDALSDGGSASQTVQAVQAFIVGPDPEQSPTVTADTRIPDGSTLEPPGSIVLVNTTSGGGPACYQNVGTTSSPVWVLVGGPRTVRLKLSGADFTPTATGVDDASLTIVPYDPIDQSAVSWEVVDIIARLATAASSGTTSVKIQRSTSTGAFFFVNYINTTSVDIAGGANRQGSHPPAIANPTVNSGDELKTEVTALGAAAGGLSVLVTLQRQE